MATPLPANQAGFTLTELLAITGGELIARGAADAVTHVSTNTRELEPGAVFVALRGKVHDAHAYVGAAAEAGARVAIVEREVDAPAALSLIRVAATLPALGDLARAHVDRWRARGGRKLIGITGSAGKTTTRVAAAALMERLWPGERLATKGNLNNRIGVPMMLFSLDARHRAAVLELGTSEKGEIAELSRIARPGVGILTLVAEAHLEGLGTVEGVAHEKDALLRSLPREGIAIGNADDARVSRLVDAAPCDRRITYGRHEAATLRITDRAPLSLDRSRVTLTHRGGRRVVFETSLIGEAGALACAAAIAAVEAAFGLELEPEWLTAAFDGVDVSLGAQRLVPHRFPNGLAAIDDTYNANPASMGASIRAAAEMAGATGRRLVLVLGEMRELGPAAARGHDAVGEAAAASGAALVFAVGGGEARRIADRAQAAGVDARHIAEIDDAVSAVTEALEADDLLLVKASRSVGADRIVAALGPR